MWTRGKKRERQIALGVGIALTAGMLSGMPTVLGAPVLDTTKGTGGVVVGDAKISDKVHTDNSALKDTNITSSSTNNVLAWKDFSNKSGETIQFDNNNYMNIVTGDNTSTIDGAVKGGGNIYLVNPNGVIFGKTAQVNVGNLYVSTRNIDPDKISGVTSTAGDLSSLVNTNVSALAADVVNLGTVQAQSVHVEAGNVRFLDASTVTSDGTNALSSAVNVRANGEVHIGYRGDYNASKDAGYQVKTLSGGTATAEYYNVVTSDDWKTKITNTPSGKFMLDGDIDAQNGGGITTTFTGKLDGMGNAFQNVAFDRGLFAETNGATIENVGIASGTISGASTTRTLGGGSFVGTATNTELYNVYNLVDVASKQSSRTGGFIGIGLGVTIQNAYNAGNITGSAFIGQLKTIDGNVTANTIQNAYSTGTASGHYLIASGLEDATLTANNIYANVSGAGSISSKASIKNTLFYDASGKGTKYYGDSATGFDYATKDQPSVLKKATFTDKPGWSSISNTGAVTRNSDGSTSRATWRIYENQSSPILTSLTKGVKTISYDYTQGDKVSGSNGGKDLSVTYNANDLAIKNIDYGSADSSIVKQSTGTLHDANVLNSDTGAIGIAEFYSDQTGYDLVGGNVTIKQRTVTIKSDADPKPYSREYDGTADASGAIASMFTGDSSSAEGIIAGDDTVSIDTSAATAKFVKTQDSKWVEDADVGAGKTILLNGSVTLKNATGHNNYVLSADSTSFNNKTFTNADNKIAQKALYVDFASGKGTGINREYSGVKNTSVSDAYLPTADTFTLSDPVKITNADGTSTAEDVSLVYDSTANYVDTSDVATGKAGDYTNRVKYGGLKLTGAKAKNYYLVAGSATDNKGTIYQEAYNGVGQDINKNAGGSLYGSGTITKKNLTNQDYSWLDNSTFQNATREYTGKSAYDAATVKYVAQKDSSGNQTAPAINDDMHFVVQNADFVDSQGSTTTTKDVDKAKAVKYVIHVDGADAENYTLNGQDIDTSTGKTYDVWGDGTITPRTINIAIDTTKKATKDYDATDDVKNASGSTSLTWDDGYIKYAVDDAAHKLVDGETDVIVYTGKYQKTGNDAAAKDVNYDSTGATADKNVSYAVKIQHADGTASTNYRIVEGTGTSTDDKTELTLNGTGVGRINPKKLTNVKFADVNKTYDTNADVGNYADYVKDGTTYHDRIAYAVENGTADGIVESGGKLADVIDSTKLVGKYGQVDSSGNFTENAHVHRTDVTTETAHDMQYTGTGGSSFLTALKNHNYTIDDTSFASGGSLVNGAYIEKKAGTIDPTKIDTISFGLKNDITKVYDGNTSILVNGNGVTDYRSLLTDLIGTLPNGQTITLDYSVVTDGGKTPVYDSKNVKPSQDATRNNIQFYIKVDESGDVSLAKALHAGTGSTDAEIAKSEEALGYNMALDKSAFHGTITPRELQVKTTDKTADRAYDRTALVNVDGRTKLTLADGFVSYANDSDTAHHLVSGEEKALIINGTYQKTNSETAGKDVSYDADGNVAQKNINYTFSFDDSVDAEAKNNYTVSPSTVTGKGTITPLALTINAGRMEKTYDGTNALSADNIKSITLTNPELKQLEAGDDVALNTDTLKKATYGSANAGEKNVTYTLELTGDDKGNFYIAKSTGDTDTLVKNGKGANATYTLTTTNNYISPLDLEDKDIWFDFSDIITKVYDGNNKVDYDHTGWESWQNDGTKTAKDFVRHLTIGTKSNDLVDKTGAFQSKGSFTANATYDSANAGTQNVHYSFTLDKDAANNYGWSKVTFKTENADGTVTLTKDTTGTISPQKIIASLISTPVQKTYDGTTVFTGVTDASGNAIASADKLISLISASGSDVGATITGTFGNKGHVKFDNDGKVTSAGVDYTVSLNNGGNYQLLNGSETGAVTAGTDPLTLSGSGIINQKEITALSFGKVAKTYDGTSAVGSDDTNLKKTGIETAVSGGSAEGLVNNETFDKVIDASKITADYGDKDGDNFTTSSNVRRDSNGLVIAKDVAYRAKDGGTLAKALKENGTGNHATDYKLSDALNKETFVQQDGGTINPKSIALEDAMKVSYKKDITRVFEKGSTDVAYDHTGWLRQKDSAKAGDYIDFVRIEDVITGGHTDAKEATGGFTIESAKYNDATGDGTAHVDTAKSATFKIVLSDDAKKGFDNYEFTDTSATSGYDAKTHTLTFTATNGMKDGVVAGKTVNVGIEGQQAFAVATGEITRAYDGTTDLYGNRTDKGHEKEEIAQGTKDLSSLVDIQSSDGTVLTDTKNKPSGLSVTGAFSQKDVKWNKTDNPNNPYITDVDLNYKATLGTNDYTLYDGNASGTSVKGADTLSFTGTGKGRITPYEITNIDFDFSEVTGSDYNKKAGDTVANKAYDATSAVKNIVATFNGVGNEKMVITNDDNNNIADGKRITGTYGKTSDGTSTDTFQEDANANYDASKELTPTGANDEEKHTGYKAVKYQNLDLAMAEKKTGTDGFNADNYTIANTKIFAEEAKKGKIRRLALTADAVKGEWANAPSKEYDATAAISKEAAGGLYRIHTDASKVGVDVAIKYDVDGDESYFSKDGARHKDAGTGLDAQIKINSIDAADVGTNFKMDAADLPSILNGLVGSDHIVKTTGNATITPRKISYHLINKSNTVNGIDPGVLSKVYDGTATVAEDSDAYKNIEIDRGFLAADTNTKIARKVYYDDKNATSTQGKATGGRKITYELTIENGNGNYVFNNNQGTKTDTAYGDIWKKQVTYDFSGGKQATGIDKTYDGTTNVDAAKKDLVVIDGLISGDKAGLDKDAISVSYDDGGVKKDAHDVTFSGIALTGDDAKNYELVASDEAIKGGYAGGSGTLIGKGTINPKKIAIRTTGNNSKVYDGNTQVYSGDAVDAAHRNNDGRDLVSDISDAKLAIDSTALVGTDDLGLHLDKASYKDASAGDTKAIDYNISWDNGNYDVVADSSTTGSINNPTGGKSATFTAQNGAIAKRRVDITVDKEAEKTYDGTKNLNDVSDFLTAHNVVTGDTVKVKAKGTYDDENAADNETQTEKDHTVTYTDLSLDNANYEVDSATTTLTGKGKIHRAKLNIIADPKSAYIGDALPAFTGRVTGFIPGESGLSPLDFRLNYAGVPQQPGSYGVYGWYGDRKEGNYDRNYFFQQDPGNARAFTLNMLDPGKHYHEAIDDLPVTPNNVVYDDASKDKGNAYGRNPRYAIEYPKGDPGNGVDYAALEHDSTVAADVAEAEKTAKQANAAVQDKGVINLTGGDVLTDEEILERLLGQEA